MIFLVLFAIFVIYVLYKYVKSYKLQTNNTILCITGTMGTGKTFVGSAMALKLYKRQNLKHKIYKRFPLFRFVCRESVNPAHIYSNIPLRLKGKEDKIVWSEVLTDRHILCLDTLPENCVVFIDELGQFCSQWEFDNPYVMQNVQILVRFFRHFTNGKMIVTDQVSSNIVKPIRDRLGYVYQLNNFSRCLKVLPFYTVECLPILCIDDGSTSIQANIRDISGDTFLFGYLPYKWMRKKRYESRCYRYLYTKNAQRHINEFDDFYTQYLIDLSVSQDVKKDYKKNIDHYKNFMYNRTSDISASDGSSSPLISLNDFSVSLSEKE